MATMARAEKARIFDRFSRYINRGQVKYLGAAHLDVLETERQGVSFCDPFSGRRMYDCFTSAGCFNVARHNPEVLAALEAAVDEAGDALDMGTWRLMSPYKSALAAKLAEISPGDVDGVLFAAGGGDAIEQAIKLARGATGRPGVVAMIKAYHGHTGFALSANGKKYYRHYFEPLMPGFTFVPYNDMTALLSAVSAQTAAVILEPVQGEAGIFPADPEYLRTLRALCDETGTLLIFDEIQTGFGRTGRMFAAEHSGVVPDIMTVAKSLGGGLVANAATLYRRIPRIESFLAKHPHFHESVAGGSDLACRVSLKVIDYIVRNKLDDNAEVMGGRLKQALLDLRRDNPRIIKEVRGVGMMVGLEYVHEFMGPMMSDALAKHGVFAIYSGNAPQVMRFMIPITITAAEMDAIINAIGAAVKDMKTLLPFALAAVRLPGVLKLLNNEHVQASLFSFLRRFERNA